MKSILTEVQVQNLRDISNLLEGLNKFRSNKTITVPRREVAHQIGSSALLRYNSDNCQPVLIVPSLINKYTILDLNDKNSFMLELKANELSPFLINWDEPSSSEETFSLSDYVNRLIKFSDFLVKQTGRKPVLVGYCMGGQLAVAASCLKPENFSGLVTISTPWSFNHKDFSSLKGKNTLEFIKSRGDIIDPSFIRKIFYLKSPFHINKKYQEYAEGKYDDTDFLYLEHWVNDCIGITRNVLVELIESFITRQDPANGKWIIRDKRIDPSHLTIKSLCAIAKKDSIAPLQDCMALYTQLNNCRLEIFDTGHIGMIINKKHNLACKIKDFSLSI